MCKIHWVWWKVSKARPFVREEILLIGILRYMLSLYYSVMLYLALMIIFAVEEEEL